MKYCISFILCLVMILSLAACGSDDNSSQTNSDNSSNTSSEKVYVDANTDFTGQITIVGRWHCVSRTETKTNETEDVSDQGQYYIFQSNGLVENYYMDELMVEYDSYKFVPIEETKGYKQGDLTIVAGEMTIELNCIVEEKRLTLSTKNEGSENYRTVYERVDFTEEQKTKK